MDERTMYELLEIYDAQEELHRVVVMLIDEDCGAGYGEGILGKLSHVTDIIMRNSPLYHPGEDYNESEFCRILEDETINNYHKSRILLRLEA